MRSKMMMTNRERMCLLALFMVVGVLVADPAWAQATGGTSSITCGAGAAASGDATVLGSGLVKGLNNLISLLNGGVARSLAVLSVIGFGIGALVGRLDWMKALTLVLAIGIVFSASAIVGLFC